MEKHPSKTRTTLFIIISLIIIALGTLAINEICYQGIRYFRRYEGVVVLLNLIRYLCGFSAVCLIFPLSNFLELKYEKKIMSERYGNNWWRLSEEERHMIEIILLEEKRKEFPAYYDAQDPELHKEAKRRTAEKHP